LAPNGSCGSRKRTFEASAKGGCAEADEVAKHPWARSSGGPVIAHEPRETVWLIGPARKDNIPFIKSEVCEKVFSVFQSVTK
jgi:hypothetical protein